MNLLFANDRKGAYPNSWYRATTEALAPYPPLRGEAAADVCIVGAGYTGLSAALRLAEAGRRVVLLEAHRVGFGASGRNGGQLGTGMRVDQPAIDQMFGQADGAKLWRLANEAVALVKDLIARHQIDCHLMPGIADATETQAGSDALRRYADYMAERHDHPLTHLDRDAFAALCPSPAFCGGLLDEVAGHLHPLAYALGLARAADAAGVRIYEGSYVHDLTKGSPNILRTDAGQVHAEHVILAGNGYLQGLDRKLASRVMPINNFVVATEPLGLDTKRVLTRPIAICDERFVVNYFRLSHDGRLLFGGGESYGYRFPKDIARLVRKPMTRIYPHLRDVRIDYAWGGTLAITMKRMPYLAKLSPSVLTAAGYSGHGIGTATQAGHLMAEAIIGESDGFETLSALPSPAFPGGGAGRSPLLALAMSWYALRDRLGL